MACWGVTGMNSNLALGLATALRYRVPGTWCQEPGTALLLTTEPTDSVPTIVMLIVYLRGGALNQCS